MYSSKLDALLKKSSGQKLKVIDPTDLEITISEIPAAAPAPAPVAASVVPVAAPAPAAPLPAPAAPAAPVPTGTTKVTYFSSAKKAPVSQSQKKRKILFVSTHCHQYNGYSKVAWNILKVLSTVSDLDVHHYGLQQAASASAFRPYPSSIKSYAPTEDEGFGFSSFNQYVVDLKPEVIVFYNDAAIINRFLSVLEDKPKIIAYLDHVYGSMSQDTASYLNNNVDAIFVFSKLWIPIVKASGFTKPIHSMTHGFDSELHPTVDKITARTALDIPTEPFYIVCTNRNTSRKRYDLLVMAFAKLVLQNPDKDIRLLCACDSGHRGGYPIMDIYRRELSSLVRTHEHKLILIDNDLSLTDERINLIYNAADIGVSCADSESFGLCAFEMMGLGKPQVVAAQTGHLEYCNSSNSIIVPTKNRYYVANSVSSVAGQASSVTVDDLCSALQSYVLNPDFVLIVGEAAKKTVAAYTWSKACAEFILRLRMI
jgi:glycosyltransferase involved in cell wall biosynthesis